MAENIISPGVFTRENDLSFLPQGIGAIGAAVVGPTQKGTAFVPTLIRNGFNKNLSGDIIYTMMPNWTYYRKGSTHGTRFNHDTHVPLLLYGNGIKKGSINRRTDVIDIAPTIASVLGINSPNASTGKVIYEAIDD